MPSAYGVEGICDAGPLEQSYLDAITKNAEHAMKMGMFLEWLDAFIVAYNTQRSRDSSKPKWEHANIASQAGLFEWDM